MKKRKDIEDNFGKLDQGDLEKIIALIADLEIIKTNTKLTEDGLRKLENCSLELESLRKSYYWRVFRLLKQGHMLD